MDEFALDTGQPTANLAQAVCPAQLAEDHGHKLRPAVKALGPALCLVLNDKPLKVRA